MHPFFLFLVLLYPIATCTNGNTDQVGEVVWPGFHILCVQQAESYAYDGAHEALFADGSRIRGEAAQLFAARRHIAT